MVEFSPTQLHNNSSQVFNEVQSKGAVKIKSKIRPDFVLCTQKHIDEITNQRKGLENKD